MAFVLVNEGKLNWLTRIIASPTYAIHLYQDDIAFDRDTVAADFNVIEADFDGYLPQDATGWTSPIISVANGATSSADPQTYTCTGTSSPNTIYGFYVLDDTLALVGAERFAGVGIDMSLTGQSFTMTPKFTEKSEVNN